MAVRYDANVKNMQELVSQGVLWAWTSSHPNCSPRCKDWQGRLYSLFKGTVEINGIKYGEKGYIDGIKYDPIDEALRGENGDGNGIISGYNCRHRLIAYKHGSKPPTDYSEAEIAREYAVDKQQRSYENRIRQMKTEERQLRAAGYLEEAKKLRKRWRLLTLDYEIYSIEHKRAFYRYRCVIDRAEEEQNSLTKIEIKIINSNDNLLLEKEQSLNNYLKIYNSRIVKPIIRKEENQQEWERYDADYIKCKEEEPKISLDIKELSKRTGMPLFGFNHRLKSKESYDRKVNDKRLNQSYKPLGDTIRYTFIHSLQNSATQIKQHLDKLKEKGYTIIKIDNKWKSNGVYKGVNIDLIAPSGVPLEIQYLTKRNIKLKEVLHKYYEIARDSTTPKEIKILAENKMQQLAKLWKYPEGIEEL